MPPPLLTQPPSPSTQSHRSSESAVVAAAIEFASNINFADAEDKEQEDVDLAAVGGVHHSNTSNENDENVHDNESSVRMDFVPRGTKTTGETEDDQQPEEEKNDDNKEMRITRLDIKSKSKMNDADLCNFSTPN